MAHAPSSSLGAHVASGTVVEHCHPDLGPGSVWQVGREGLASARVRKYGGVCVVVPTGAAVLAGLPSDSLPHTLLTYSSSLAACAGAPLPSWHLFLLPKNWVHVSVGVKTNKTKQNQKNQPRQRSGEGRIYYLLQVRRTPGIFPKAVSPQQKNWGSFKLRIHAYS